MRSEGLTLLNEITGSWMRREWLMEGYLVKYLPQEDVFCVKLGVLDPLEMMSMRPDLLRHRAQPLYRQLCR